MNANFEITTGSCQRYYYVVYIAFISKSYSKHHTLICNKKQNYLFDKDSYNLRSETWFYNNDSSSFLCQMESIKIQSPGCLSI